jgi:hypothetical protein
MFEPRKNIRLLGIMGAIRLVNQAWAGVAGLDIQIPGLLGGANVN